METSTSPEVVGATGGGPVDQPGPGVQVLIPQNYPGAFYYPPCKCDLVNQVL